MEHPIDFVITWVDSSDTAWQKEFERYTSQHPSPTTQHPSPTTQHPTPTTQHPSPITQHPSPTTQHPSPTTQHPRFRDWDLLRYWFRGVEKFAPWVRYIHFVTNGQVPAWLNTSNPKIRLVRHEDYIPQQYLPLFNSNPIELMMNRIPDLAEHFVYFNDDFFLVKPVTEEYFFKNGKPCDVAILCNHHASDIMRGITEQNMSIINKEYDIFSQIKQHPRLWFRLQYGRYLLQTISGCIAHKTVAPADTHTAQPYLKSVIDTIWEKHGNKIIETMTHRFRQYDDVSHWLFRYWQIVDGIIEPVNVYNNIKAFYSPEEKLNEIEYYITRGDKPVVIINDNANINDFPTTAAKAQSYFRRILPDASTFEKD